jgi:DNA-binding LacI/PurR family transcriptional regulator
MRRPTIADVAARAGVSKGAVSFALNGRDGVSEQTRDRILAAAVELGWQPSLRARSLSVSRAFTVGLVVARPAELLGADPFFPAFIAGVETVLSPAGQSLLLQVVPTVEAEEDGYRRFATDGRVDGVFLTDLRTHDSRIGVLRELGLAAVTLNRPDVDSPFPAVCMDDRPGVRHAVELLIELGHRRIAHVSGPLRFLHSRHRMDSWSAVMRAAGLDADLRIESDFTAAGGAAATTELLDSSEPPTAIVYANDVMAIAGLGVAHTRGLSVPRDLSVVGFDGTDIASHVHPPLTTVVTDPFGWGRLAAQTLLRVTAGTDERVDDVQLSPAHLVVRASTARASEDPPPTDPPTPR